MKFLVSTLIASTLVGFATDAVAAKAPDVNEPAGREAVPLPDPRACYDAGVNFGTLMPTKNGLDSLIPGWGLRFAIPTDKGVFEFSGYSGIGNGIVFRDASIDYRMDIQVETLATHFLLGMHADAFDQSSPVPAHSSFAGGAHYGGGATMQLAGPLYLRFDFRHRFSPGQILEVTAGILYRIPSTGGGT